MRDFLAKISDFMYGRYGADKLNLALFVLWFVLNFFNTLIFRSIWVHLILYVIVGLIIFRFLSKNIEKRRKENEKFLNMWFKVKPFFKKIQPFFKKIADWFKLQVRKFKDRKTHRYIKCPYCKVVLRVPFRKGNHSLKCPHCRGYIKTNIRF